MELDALIRALAPGDVIGGRPVEILDLAYDTRRVRAGSLFFCVPGATRDGHDLAGEAVAAGAVALVVERPLEADVPQPNMLKLSRDGQRLYVTNSLLRTMDGEVEFGAWLFDVGDGGLQPVEGFAPDFDGFASGPAGPLGAFRTCSPLRGVPGFP